MSSAGGLFFHRSENSGVLPPSSRLQASALEQREQVTLMNIIDELRLILCPIFSTSAEY